MLSRYSPGRSVTVPVLVLSLQLVLGRGTLLAHEHPIRPHVDLPAASDVVKTGLANFNALITEKVLAHHASSLLDLDTDAGSLANALTESTRTKTWESRYVIGYSGANETNRVSGSTRAIEDAVVNTGFDVASRTSTFQMKDVNGNDTQGWAGTSKWRLQRYDAHKEWTVEPDYEDCSNDGDSCTPGFRQRGVGLAPNGTIYDLDDACRAESVYRNPNDRFARVDRGNGGGSGIEIDPPALTGAAEYACGRSLRVYRLTTDCDLDGINAHALRVEEQFFGNATLSNHVEGYVAVRTFLYAARLDSRIVIDADDLLVVSLDSHVSQALHLYLAGASSTDPPNYLQEYNQKLFVSMYSQNTLRSVRLGDPGADAFAALSTCAAEDAGPLPAAPSAAWYDERGHLYASEEAPPSDDAANSVFVRALEAMISDQVFADYCRVVVADDSLFAAPIEDACPVPRSAQFTEPLAVTGDVDPSAAIGMKESSMVNVQPPSAFFLAPTWPTLNSSTATPTAPGTTATVTLPAGSTAATSDHASSTSAVPPDTTANLPIGTPVPTCPPLPPLSTRPSGSAAARCGLDGDDGVLLDSDSASLRWSSGAGLFVDEENRINTNTDLLVRGVDLLEAVLALSARVDTLVAQNTALLLGSGCPN